METRATAAANPFRRAGSDGKSDPVGAVDVTLLFCDVVRSTELTERLGDRAAYVLIQRFHDLVEQCASRCEGAPLEVRGDGVLLAFDDPRRGLGCAIGIQQSLADEAQQERLSVRIGVHAGRALRVPVGYFGAAVILSARIAAYAEPGEILASGALRERVREADAFRFDAERWIELKGFPRPSQVFAVAWRRERDRDHEPRRASIAAPSAVPSDRHGTSAIASGILAGAWQSPG